MIREGRGFSEALDTAAWLPELALDMMAIGEKSGSLREMLDEVAVFYDAEAEVRLEQLTTLLEPADTCIYGRHRCRDFARDLSADHPNDLRRADERKEITAEIR